MNKKLGDCTILEIMNLCRKNGCEDCPLHCDYDHELCQLKEALVIYDINPNINIEL